MITVVYLDCENEDSNNKQAYNQDSKKQKNSSAGCLQPHTAFCNHIKIKIKRKRSDQCVIKKKANGYL